MNDMTQNTEKIKAVLRCVVRPDEKQTNGFVSFLKREYQTDDVELDIVEDPKIWGGFILEVGSEEYDWSLRGRENQIGQRIDHACEKAGTAVSQDKIISILRAAAEDFKVTAEKREVGFVETAGDGIVTVHGLRHAMYGEIILFENGVKGMVQNITDDGIGAILFDEEGTIGEGSKVVGTGKQAGIPVSDEYLGRVINALGEPIDGGAEIHAGEYRPIEEPAPGIVERKSVSEPLQTGILSIDSMFPIGRGQRELIIGDRQTGKTSIAVDTILNQKGKNCICIYVAIGQKASTIAGLVNTLQQHGAMEYSIVVSSTASDPAPLQYVAPYSATSLAEYFMHKGQDVLIVYDDLSKHAVAYRALSLLLGRSPGREAYPGDVFYLHSRLLERSARLSDELGGGSITALPIIETQDGDVSAYIPTNVISITDGQIFLESDLFFEGQRPAVNVGLSVSRVGGAAQTKAMKQVAGTLRLDLASYQELAGFTQFGSDLDEATQKQLTHGARMTELLKQPRYKPFEVSEQIVALFAGNEGFLDDPEIADVLPFRAELIEYMDNGFGSLLDKVRAKKIDDDTKAELLRVIGDFKQQFMAKHHADTTGSEEN